MRNYGNIALFATIFASSAAMAEEPPLPSTCGTPAAGATQGTDQCEDGDGDEGYKNDSDPAKVDCKDDDPTVGAAFPLILGDGKDNDCNGTGDDAEYEEAKAAAGDGDPESPKAIAYMALVDECLAEGGFAEEVDGFVWGPIGHGRWGCIPTDPAKAYGFGWSRSLGVQTRADQANASGLAKVRSQIVDLVVKIQGSDGTWAWDKADEGVEKRLAKANSDLGDRVTKVEQGLEDVTENVRAQGTRLTVIETAQDAYDMSGPEFKIESIVGLITGRPNYEFSGGPLVRADHGSFNGLALTIGQAWSGAEVYATFAGGQGSRASDGGDMGHTLGLVAVGIGKVGTHASIALEGVGELSAMSDETLFVPAVSSSGLGGGAKLEVFLTSPASKWRVGVTGSAAVIAEQYGTNNSFHQGTAGIFTGGLTVARAPVRVAPLDEIATIDVVPYNPAPVMGPVPPADGE